MGKFRNFIDSFFQGNDVPSDREELMRRLDAMEEENMDMLGLIGASINPNIPT